MKLKNRMSSARCEKEECLPKGHITVWASSGHMASESYVQVSKWAEVKDEEDEVSLSGFKVDS